MGIGIITINIWIESLDSYRCSKSVDFIQNNTISAKLFSFFINTYCYL